MSVAVQGLEERILRRRQGKDLSVVMGNLLFKDLITCVGELVANSHDADAENVRIDYASFSGLTIFDDGTGMDMDGLEGFYRMGESPKREKQITEKGRSVIGKFGIASLVLRTLAEHYVLETWKDGLYYTVEETFSGDDTDSKEIVVKSDPCDQTRHGTRIKIDKLKFLRDGRELDLDLLRKRLSVEMPILPDFSIFINRTQIEPRVVSNAVEYVVDIDDKLLGHVHGSIWYSSKPFDEGSGIYIKVHGRAVGGPNADIFGGKMGLVSRLFGVVHADGLEDIIGFDRDNFLRDHPKVKKLREYLVKILGQIRQDMDMDLKMRNRNRAKEVIAKVSPYIGKLIGDAFGEEQYKIVFKKDGGKIAYVDRETRTLVINPLSTLFSVKDLGKESITDSLLRAARYGIISGLIPEHEIMVLSRLEEGSRKFLRAGNRGKVISLADLVFGDGDNNEIYRISPARLYDYPEITRAVGYRNPILKRMVASRLLQDRNGKLFGQDVLDVIERIGGWLSLSDVIEKLYPERSQSHKIHKEDDTAIKLDRIVRGGGELPNYVRNLAVEKPGFFVPSFYAVNGRGLSSFKRFLETGEFPSLELIVGKRYHWRSLPTKSGEDKGVLVYALRISDEEDIKVIREAVVAELEFVKDRGALPDGIKTISCYAPMGETRYVLGVYAGSGVNRLRKRFDENGFTYVDVKGKEPTTLYMGVSAQRAQHIPLIVKTGFGDSMAKIIKSMFD